MRVFDGFFCMANVHQVALVRRVTSMGEGGQACIKCIPPSIPHSSPPGNRTPQVTSLLPSLRVCVIILRHPIALNWMFPEVCVPHPSWHGHGNRNQPEEEIYNNFYLYTIAVPLLCCGSVCFDV